MTGTLVILTTNETRVNVMLDDDRRTAVRPGYNYVERMEITRLLPEYFRIELMATE